MKLYMRKAPSGSLVFAAGYGGDPPSDTRHYPTTTAFFVAFPYVDRLFPVASDLTPEDTWTEVDATIFKELELI